MSLAECDIVEPVQPDRESEFEVFFSQEYARLTVLLSAVDETAEDAVQEAFVEAYLRWSRIRSLDDPAGWVRRVAINRMLNVKRGRRREEAARSRLLQTTDDRQEELKMDVRSSVRRLPRQQRVVVVLHYGGGYRISEIADLMRLSEGTVKSHLHAARTGLRAWLARSSDV